MWTILLSPLNSISNAFTSQVTQNFRDTKLNKLKTHYYLSLQERNFHVGQQKPYQSSMKQIS